MRNLNSKKHSHIRYEKEEEIFLLPAETNLPFYFDVTEDLTGNDEAMDIVAAALDDVDTLEKTAKAFLKSTLADDQSKYYGTVAYFMEFHRDELDPDACKELFQVADPSALSFAQMVDFLKVNRFGSFVDTRLEQQVFIMDLSFDPEITDELMVVYFNLAKQVLVIAHES